MQRIANIRLSEIENTRIPNLGKEIEKNLSHWIGKFDNISGHELMEKVLSLVTTYRFDKNYLNIIDERTFELLTENNKVNKKITIKYYFSDVDNPGGIIITDGNNSYDYELLRCNNEELTIELDNIKELDTGFEEHFFYSFYNNKTLVTFRKINDDSKMTFSSDDLYDYSDYELFKREFKKTEFKDIMDLYYYIINNWPSLASNFEIIDYGKHACSWESSQRIAVENGRIKAIRLTKEENGNSFKISEYYENTKDNNTLTELYVQLQDLHNTQNQLRMRLKKDIS